MRSLLKIIILNAGFVLTLVRFAFSADQAEQLTITTYYPSPYGSYNELQLYPHPAPVTPCGPDTKGTLYYNSSTNYVMLCRGNVVDDWINIGGGSDVGSGLYWKQGGNNLYVSNTNWNIGIGTVPLNAQMKLEVNGNVRLTKAMDLALYDNKATITSEFVNLPLRFKARGFDKPDLVVAPSGRVGIGTVDPSYGGKVGSKFTINAADVVGAAGTGLAIGYNNTLLSFAINPQSDGSWQMWDYYGDRWNLGLVERGGKVGIGTPNPTKKLEINGTMGFTGGQGPFCIFAKACPTGWVDKGLGGYIRAAGASCPYAPGAAFNPGWIWCHPRICCNE